MPLIFASGLFDLFLETVKKMEYVSEHFGYTEEYVLARPYLWLLRKFDQFNRSQYDKRRYMQADTVNGLLAVHHFTNNNEKEAKRYILDDYETHIKKQVQEAKSGNRSSKGKSFSNDQVDAFAFMPPAMKERLKQKA